MLVIVPEAGKFAEYEANLPAQRLAAIVAGVQSKTVALAMPKFTYTQPCQLKQALGVLGMPITFTPAADFSGMNAKTNLFLADVYHKAFVRVDEKGTEAAAATAARMEAKAEGPNRGVTLTIDRPFIFLIRDTRSGVILFMGRVLDPRG